MAHPLIFSKNTFFYPIGNTPPACLTQDISPEQPANVLLLGCGDARNVLFTVHCSGLDVNILPQKLDFTCCDMEPAVLARNVLLLTMIVDDKIPFEQMWNIYYDFFIKERSLSLLCGHARKLVDASADLETWQEKYGYFIRVVNRQTLQDLRRYWTFYGNFEGLPSTHVARVKSTVKAKMQDTLKTYGSGAILSLARSAGPLLVKALELASGHYRHLWRTGVHSTRPDDVANATCVNPTFTYSSVGEDFMVHYGTDAIAAFHLSPLFAATKAPPKPQAMIDAAQAQFKEWCSSFRRVVASPSPKVVIRLFAGDALSLSRALHHCSCTSETLAPTYISPWQTPILELDVGEYGPNANPRAPVIFDVIDSSNLADHVGLVNVLVLTQPILSRKPSSVLYTETLLPMGTNSITGFTDQACGDLTVLSILLDLVPSSFISKFTSVSNSHEVMLQRLMSETPGSQYHERTSWKVLSFSDAGAFRELGSCVPVKFEPKQLGTFLFGVYLKMFCHESVMWQREQAQQGTLTRFLLHYTRGSFVSLLRLVKSRQTADWERTMDTLFDSWNTDRTLMLGMNSYQDMCVQMHIFEVYSVDPLKPGWIKAPQGGRFEGWKTIPEMVCIVLVVPRGRFKIVEDIKSDKLRTPSLMCSIKGPAFQNDFSTVTAVYGSVSTVGLQEQTEVVLHPDPDGRAGKLPLVVSFWAPSWILSKSPNETTINLGLHNATGVHLLPELGLELAIYKTNLLDKEHVCLSQSRPNIPNELDGLKAALYDTRVAVGTREVTVTLDSAGAKVSAFMVRIDISDATNRQELLDGATVDSEQETPSTITVRFGSFGDNVYFPFPVDGTRTRLRVARKSHYIEVIASAAGPRTSGGYYVDPAPVMLQGTIATTWNVHRVYLERLPRVDVLKQDALDWMNVHVSLMFADRERDMRSGGQLVNQSAHQTLVDVKDSLHHIFGMFVGQAGGGRHRVFSLSDPGEGGVYTLLFIKELRLDLGAHTVVLDGYVLPLDISDVKTIPRMLETSDIASALAIKTAGKEVEAWKRLLPALVERCRRTWEHQTDCEYVVGRWGPRTTELEGNPICNCGRGRDVDGFKTVKAWAPFAGMVTRIAISPLFAVSYLETIAASLGERVAASEGTRGRTSGASASPVPPLKTTDSCGRCGGGGKPKLLVCGGCKRAWYCSAECQRVDWGEGHKKTCRQAI